MQQETTTFAAFISIDWADLVVHVPGRSKREKGILAHRPAVIDARAQKLHERSDGAPIAIALELSRGPLVSALLEHNVFVVFPVNPAMLAKYRLAFTPSRAKDDPTDAEIALELPPRHPEKVPPLRRESPDMRALQRMVEDRRSLVEDRVRLTDRLANALKAYFPQAVAWSPDKETAVFADFLERWPTLDDAQRPRGKTLLDFFHEHNVRSTSAIEDRIAKIRTEQPLTTDNAVIAPARLLVQALVPQLRAVCQSIARFNADIDRVSGRLADYHLFRALPGTGPVFAARLLVAFGECRERFPTAEVLQCYAGVAPVTERSGNKTWVHWRWSCPTFLRQTFVEWVGQTISRSFWADAFYARKKARGATHAAAIRALAFKWTRILHRCWVDRQPYEESRYLSALQKRSSPVLKFAVDAAH